MTKQLNVAVEASDKMLFDALCARTRKSLVQAVSESMYYYFSQQHPEVYHAVLSEADERIKFLYRNMKETA